jgi:16S rRNA (guanine527-N7)-methyltransferase
VEVPTGKGWLAAVAGPYGITDLELLSRFAELIRSDKAIPRKYRTARKEMMAQSLGAVQLPAVRAARRLADIGAGYGYPGLVLACVLDAEVYLVEPDRERSAWLQEAVAGIGLSNTCVVSLEAERWDERGCDVVTAKNVAHLSTMVEWAAPLLRVGGDAVIWMRGLGGPETFDGFAAALFLGLDVAGLLRAHDWEIGRRTDHLLVLHKARPTPDGFPREPRMAWRCPLGAESDGGVSRAGGKRQRRNCMSCQEGTGKSSRSARSPRGSR